MIRMNLTSQKWPEHYGVDVKNFDAVSKAVVLLYQC